MCIFQVPFANASSSTAEKPARQPFATHVVSYNFWLLSI